MSNLKNPTDISGLLGEQLKVRKVNNQVVITNRPKKKAGPPTPDQEKVNSRFRQAIDYARWQMSIPEEKADYQSRVTEKIRSAHVVAMTDFLTAPVVEDISISQYKGVAGDIIRIVATDDFRVTKVLVSILAADGTELESGDAVQHPAKYWVYATTVANPQMPGTVIKVIAFDKPGNETAAEKKL